MKNLRAVAPPTLLGVPACLCHCWFSGTCSTQTCCIPSLSASASFTPAHTLILAGLSSDITLSPALSHPSWHLFSRCALSGFQCHKRGDRVCPVHVNVFWHASSGSLWFCSFRSGLRFLSPRRLEDSEAGGRVSVSLCCFKAISATSKFPPSCFIFPAAFPGCSHVHSCFPEEFY